MQGSLVDKTVPDLVQHFHAKRASGVLRLTHGEVKKSIYFKDGAVVMAHSNLKSDRLGETLLRLGKITEEEFHQASANVVQRKKRLGNALAEKGFLSLPEVIAGVTYQVQQIIYSVFNWDSGRYEFIERARPVFEDVMVDFSTVTILMDGIRNIVNRRVLQHSLERHEHRYLYRNIDTGSLTRMNFELPEETILACVDGRRTTQMIRELSRLTPLEFDRAAYCLLVAGLIRSEETKRDDATDSDAKWHDYVTRDMHANITEEEIRKLIPVTERQFQAMSDEEVLRLLPDSNKDEIQKAFDTMSGVFQPFSDSAETSEDLKPRLKYITNRLALAYDRLMQRAASHVPLNAIESRIPSTSVEENLAIQPSNAAILRQMGESLHKEGRAREAEQKFLDSLAIEPTNIETHFALADFYQARGLKFKAFHHLNLILHLDPENSRALELLNLKKTRKALYEITPQRAKESAD